MLNRCRNATLEIIVPDYSVHLVYFDRHQIQGNRFAAAGNRNTVSRAFLETAQAISALHDSFHWREGADAAIEKSAFAKEVAAAITIIQ